MTTLHREMREEQQRRKGGREGKSINFLGMKVKMPSDGLAAKQELKARLKHLLQAVDGCLVTHHQKLKLFKLGICPRLNWLLTIYKYPITWIERELDSMTIKFLKKWTALAKSANTGLLYLPQCDGGLNLPSPSSLYQCLQVSRQCQLLTSADPTVRLIAEENLKVRDGKQEEEVLSSNGGSRSNEG